MKTYRTSEIAALIGIHPNTVRFYEAQGLLPPVPRRGNGYRIFHERHLLQLKLIRQAFKAEILSNNLRNEAVAIVKYAAMADIQSAIERTILYGEHLHAEIKKAKEALILTQEMMNGGFTDKNTVILGRRQAAAQIGVSMDILRDWERNGLVHVPRRGNRRQYGIHEMNRLKIIALLRSANYSQTAVRRMFAKLELGETDLRTAIDTPEQTEDIISVADRYISSLTGALRDTEIMLQILSAIKSNPPV